MKKLLLSILVVALLLGLTAFAETYKPGDTVTFVVNISSSTATMARVSMNADSAFEFVGVESISNVLMKPQGLSGNIVFGSSDGMTEFQNGSARINVKIKSGTPNGNYTLSFSLVDAIDANDKPASCTVSGSATITVYVCAHTETEEKILTEATCTTAGEQQIICKECGEVLGTEDIPMLGHSFSEYVVTTEPTCTEKGVETSTCSRCGETQTQDVAALGHTFSAPTVTKEPTCTEDGERSGTCDRCGETTTEAISALGHDYGEYEVTKEATCTEAGEKVSKCSRCTEAKSEEIAALGHDYGAYEVTKEATCTDAGEEVSKCSRCTEIQKREIAALGHKWSAWTVETEAVCVADGLRTRECENGCGEREEETIPALGHDHGKWVVITPATKDSEGYKELHCTRCDELLDSAIIPMITYTYRSACTFGVKLNSLVKDSKENKWLMVTPIDLSKDGETHLPLICSNVYLIGEAVVKVENGKLMVSLEISDRHVDIQSAELKISTNSHDLLACEPFTLDEEIEIADAFEAKDWAYMFIKCIISLDENYMRYTMFDANAAEYQALAEKFEEITK